MTTVFDLKGSSTGVWSFPVPAGSHDIPERGHSDGMEIRTSDLVNFPRLVGPSDCQCLSASSQTGYHTET